MATITQQWVCDDCGSAFESEADARICCTYVCDGCGVEYSDREDRDDCCDDDDDDDDDEEEEVTEAAEATYSCITCGRRFASPGDALRCFDSHVAV